MIRVWGHLCEEDGIGKDKVCDNSGADDQHAVQDRAVSQEIGVVLRVITLRVVIGEGHVAAEREGPQGVLDLQVREEG